MHLVVSIIMSRYDFYSMSVLKIMIVSFTSTNTYCIDRVML